MSTSTASNTPRLRAVAYVVQPQLMVDDGETLTSLPVQPLTIPASDWPHAVAMIAGAFEQLRQQVEGPPPAPPLTALPA